MRCHTTIRPVLALAALLAFAAPSSAEEVERPGGAEGVLIRVEATVTGVDMDTREVTLKDADGNETVLQVGPQARNLPQVEVGDTVIAEYYSGLVFQVEPAGTGKPMRVERTRAERAPAGRKPAGEVTTWVEIIARVEGIDRDERTVTLRGPRRVVTLKVADDVDLSKVAVDDMVEAHFLERAAISVERK